MQNKLTKILALGAIALSMGACTGNSGKVVELKDIFAYENGNFVYADKKVTLKQTAVLGQYGNTLIVGQPYEENGSILNLKAFEVELKKMPNWKGVTKGRYANVNVTGTLTNVNDRPVMKNATIKVNAEAQYDEDGNRIDNDGAYSAGYWSSEQLVRSYWDQYMGRNMNGVLFEGIFQLASVPTTVSADAGAEFFVTFPGENTNAADEDNEYLIHVTMPVGLNENAIEKYNGYFAEKAAGDYVQFMGMTYYDKTLGGMGIIMENYWANYCAEVADEDKPEILTQFAQIQAKYGSKFLTGIPNLGCEAEGVFSYGVTNHFSDDLEEYFGDNLRVDAESTGALEFAFNCGSSKTEAVFAALKTKVAALGLTLDEEYSDLSEDEDESYFSETLGVQIFIWTQGASPKAVTVFFLGPKAVLETGTFNAGVLELEARLQSSLTLPKLAASDDAKVTGAKLDLSASNDYAPLAYNFMLTAEMANDAFADDDAWEAFYESYEDALVAAGYTAHFDFSPSASSDGYFNKSTGEYACVYAYKDEDDKYAGIVIDFYLIQQAGADYLYDTSDDAAWTTQMFGYYTIEMLTPVLGLTSAKLYLISQDIAPELGIDAYFGAFNAGYEETLIGYVLNYATPSCAIFDEEADIVKTASATVDGGFDYSYTYFVNGPEAGKLLQVAVTATCVAAGEGGYFYLDSFITVVDAPNA